MLLSEHAHRAAELIYNAIAAAVPGEKRVRAVLQPYDTVGSTAFVTFDTRKQRWTTAQDRCHINFVVGDSGWELKFASDLEELDEVEAYVKNQNLGFKIPYSFEGRARGYFPDFILRVDDGHGGDNLLNLIVEVSGQSKDDKEMKVDTARKLWVPAVNAESTFGRWDFIEITDPCDTKRVIREYLQGR